jgi:hypothetical protein
MPCAGCSGASLYAPKRKPAPLAAVPDFSNIMKLGIYAAVGILIWSALKGD